MGKDSQRQPNNFSLENNPPKCTKSMFHVFHYPRWQRAKKMLPLGKHGDGRHTSVAGDQGSNNTVTHVDQMQQRDAEAEKTVDKERSESFLGTKNSKKSRIKVFKGRHWRSSSCPTKTQAEQSNPIHHPEYLELTKLASSDPSQGNIQQDQEQSSTVSALDPPRAQVSKLKKSGVDEHVVQQLMVDTSLRDNLINAIEGTENASLQGSKQFLDALDLLDIRKELFLKILCDPSSSLVQHLHDRQAFKSKIGLSKSVSFHSSASSSKRTLESVSPKLEKETILSAKWEEKIHNGGKAHRSVHSEPTMDTGGHPLPSEDENRNDHILKPHTVNPVTDDHSSPISSLEKKNESERKIVTKHFKNLRRKITHVIRESKKEKHWILMDAVLHKIPYGRKFSKAKDKNVDTWKESDSPRIGCQCDQSDSAFGKGKHIRRIASFNESQNIKYSRLLEPSPNKEGKCDAFKKLKLKADETPSSGDNAKKYFGRILSMPNLSSYSFLYGEDSLGFLGRHNVTNTDCSQKQNELNTPAEIQGREYLLEVGNTVDNLAKLETASDIKVASTFSYSMAVANQFPDSSLDPNFQEVRVVPEELLVSEDSLTDQNCKVGTDTYDQGEVNAERIETLSQHKANNFLLVDIEDEVEFKFVRDVLELSGFSGNESLGKWHSPGQALDPSMFEEVEVCLIANTECSRNEEGGRCDRIILFDLINELLLEVYERSFAYWPKRLTCCSYMRSMPMGYQVLKEVWADIEWYLSWRHEIDQSLDDPVGRDLQKDDGWMNLQFDAECVGLELDDMIFDDLLEEIARD